MSVKIESSDSIFDTSKTVELTTHINHYPEEPNALTELFTERVTEKFNGALFKSDKIFLRRERIALQSDSNILDRFLSLFQSTHETLELTQASFHKGLLQMLCKNGEMHFININALQEIGFISLGQNVSTVKSLDDVVLAFGKDGFLQVWNRLTFSLLFTIELSDELKNLQNLAVFKYGNQLFIAQDDKVISFEISDSLKKVTLSEIHSTIVGLCGDYLVLSNSTGKISVYNCKTQEWTLEKNSVHEALTMLIDDTPTLFVKESNTILIIDLLTRTEKSLEWTRSLKDFHCGFIPSEMKHVSLERVQHTIQRSYTTRGGTHYYSIVERKTYLVETNWSNNKINTSKKPIYSNHDSGLYLKTTQNGTIAKVEDLVLINHLQEEHSNAIIPDSIINKNLQSRIIYPLPDSWNQKSSLSKEGFLKPIFDGKALIGVEVLKPLLTEFRV